MNSQIKTLERLETKHTRNRGLACYLLALKKPLVSRLCRPSLEGGWYLSMACPCFELQSVTFNMRRRKKTSMPSTTRPSGICGRSWLSRRSSTICLGLRPPAGIRNRRDIAGDATITSGHFVQKWRVWGATPTSIFAAPAGPQKSQAYNTCPACH